VKKTTPHFSVFMSTYGKEEPKHLDAAIKSIVTQSSPPNEIVLVKDGLLTERLEDVIAKWIQIFPGLFKVVPLPENRGLGVALQKGLRECSNNLVARMDADDISCQDRFEKQISFLEGNAEIDIVGSWIGEFVENPEKIITVRKVPITHNEIYKFAKFRNPMNHVTVMFKKSAILKADSYQHFPFFEDYYLWIRMLLSGAKFSNIPESLVLVRIGNNMLTKRRGFKYLVTDIKFQREMLNMAFISHREFFSNLVFRGVPRLMPVCLLGLIYRHFVR